jgi:hypothetical protein
VACPQRVKYESISDAQAIYTNAPNGPKFITFLFFKLKNKGLKMMVV